MRSKLWIILLIAIIAVPAMMTAQETRLGGEFWSRWTMESGKSAADSSNIVKKNYFALDRGYVDLRTKFSENTNARFTVDMFSTDLIGDGAGLKLKYGFVDFANLVPVPDMTLTVGLQKVYFGTIYDWNYTLIGKAPTDEYKVAISADYGVTLNGFLPAGFGEYAFGVYNGEGYKKFGVNLKDNTRMEYLANLRLTPIPGITIGGSYMTNSVEREKKLSDNSAVATYQEQALMDGVLRLAYGPVDVWAEYISKDMKFPNDPAKDYAANGFMLMPILNLYSLIGTDIQIIGRYDQWDETDNPVAASKYLQNAITGGVNYNVMHDESFNPKFQVQLNVTQKTYNEDESGPSYANGMKDALQVMAQLKWRFSSTIK
ncbi:MAG: hypothetical protein Q8M98_09485 [Candidatus Cloacimonadaceae bacterium]|nr:hypothetical protein [Candidatus Cloacimonadaceae bacterium]